ncbi:MAG: hypothetical protein Q8P59_00015, partial [Dehalococcoidia bacterium]|nr:hypothetical protein [Dehalococcoidia bacterium]
MEAATGTAPFVKVGDRIKYIGPRRDFSGMGGLTGTIAEVHDQPVVWAMARLDNGHGIDIGPQGEGKVWERAKGRMQPDTDESRILKEYGLPPRSFEGPWRGFLPQFQQLRWFTYPVHNKGLIGTVMADKENGDVVVYWSTPGTKGKGSFITHESPGGEDKRWVRISGVMAKTWLPHTMGGQFAIRQMGPNQVKVSRSDRKGEFFLEFGPPVVPEGATAAEPAALADVLASLGLSQPEAKLVETGATIKIFDDDDRAPRLWQKWEEFEAESPPYSTATEVVSLEEVVAKWEQAKARNSITARRDLENLEKLGVDVTDAADALDNYQ